MQYGIVFIITFIAVNDHDLNERGIAGFLRKEQSICGYMLSEKLDLFCSTQNFKRKKRKFYLF